ncbi:MAG: hypothetical protein Fur0037_08450 [Planctomycetota bacterium]
MQDSAESSERRAPELWLDAYGQDLYRFARARLRSDADAEDALQETLLAALRSRRDFRGDSSERTWLTGILRHKIGDVLRRRERSAGAPQDPERDPIEEEMFTASGRWRDVPAPLRFGDDLLERGEFWLKFEQCLMALPERQARAFVLRGVEGEDVESICKELGVTATNLWVLLHRARLRLRSCLERNWFHVGEER